MKPNNLRTAPGPKYPLRSVLLSFLFALFVSGLAQAAWARDLEDPVATSNRFRFSLAEGNTGAAMSMLAPDVLVYTAGGEETSRDGYGIRGLKRDIAQFSSHYVEVIGQTSDVQDNLAWVSTRLRLLSKTVDSPEPMFGTETLVLRRQGTGWQIVHVHRSTSAEGPSQ